MSKKLLIQRTLEYAFTDMRYMSEVLTTQFDDEPPTIVFSVDIVLNGDGLHCTIHHHTKHGKVYHRECRYTDPEGPYVKGDNAAATLIPEFHYLMHLYKEDGWLFGYDMNHYYYGSPETARRHEHTITLYKHVPLVELRERLDVMDVDARRNRLIDAVREWNFDFELKRSHIHQTENIYVGSIPPEVERYIICTNYAQLNGNRTNAAALAVLLDTLYLGRSDFIARTNHFVPPTTERMFLDGAKGDEGARAYLWQLREAERKQILGVINLELWGDGNQLVTSRPQHIGNGKLLSALFSAAKQENRNLVKKLPSPMNAVFERDEIPLVTICNLHPNEIAQVVSLANQAETANNPMPVTQSTATISEATLQNAIDFVRQIILMLAYVKGDEARDVPDVSYAQGIENLSLLKLDGNQA